MVSRLKVPRAEAGTYKCAEVHDSEEVIRYTELRVQLPKVRFLCHTTYSRKEGQ